MGNWGHMQGYKDSGNGIGIVHLGILNTFLNILKQEGLPEPTTKDQLVKKFEHFIVCSTITIGIDHVSTREGSSSGLMLC